MFKGSYDTEADALAVFCGQEPKAAAEW